MLIMRLALFRLIKFLLVPHVQYDRWQLHVQKIIMINLNQTTSRIELAYPASSPTVHLQQRGMNCV